MKKKSIKQLSHRELSGKRVLVRVDFNVPLQEGVITDDSRIKAAIPSIEYLLDNQATVLLISHMGRPKGKVVETLRLDVVAKRLQDLLNKPVLKLNDCIGDSIKSTLDSLNESIVLLENVRFYSEETDNDRDFAKQLASLADYFVQDAFGVVHRAHASTAGISEFLPTYAGFLIEKELAFLGGAMSEPERPLVAIVGGAKVSSKIGVLNHLLDKVDTLIIGGGMAFTFFKAMGHSIGRSLCEDDKCDLALSLIKKAKDLNKTLLLPKDVVVSSNFEGTEGVDIVSVTDIPEDKMGLDVGPETLLDIKEALQGAKTVIWNGPLGVFEVDLFSKGTCEIASLLATISAVTIVGGGDSVAAIEKVGLADKMSHISTGGGACLEYLEGKVLPGIHVIEDQL